MRLVEQAILTFAAGQSEKVYEVDLCEVGPGRFVVNFRYGRRGDALKDGTRTVAPVPEADARRIYATLVTSKQDQGYVAGASPIAPAAAPAPAPVAVAVATPTAAPAVLSPPPEPGGEPRERAILARLARGDRPKSTAAGAAPAAAPAPSQRHLLFRRARRATGPVNKDWSLNRAIWRAGELRLPAAAPYLAALVGTADPLRDYCIAWALGRCGPAREGIAPLQRLRATGRTPHIKRIATASLLQLLPGAEGQALRAELAATWPVALREAVTPEAAVAALRAHLSDYAATEPARWAVCTSLYLHGGPAAAAAVLDAARACPLRPPAFQVLRHLFKLAELRDDGQLFGVVAHRIERTKANFDNRRTGWATVPHGSGVRHLRAADLAAMLASPNASTAFGAKTRWYLRQRVWRTLQRLGEQADPAYLRMAVGVLAPYTDADARAPSSTIAYQGGQRVTTHYDAYGHCWAFNHILYANSPRYAPGRRSWHTQGGYRPGQPDPAAREEAFPALWDREPRALLHLLHESRCEVVHRSAVRAVRSNAQLGDSLPVEVLAMLLTRPYEVTVQLGFDLVQRRFRPGTPPEVLRALAAAVAECSLAALRLDAHRWVDGAPATFSGDPAFLAGLIASAHADTRAFGLGFLARHPMAPAVGAAVAAGALAALVALPEDQGERAADLARALQEILAPHLGPVSAESLSGLLDSPHTGARALGAGLLSKLDDPALLARHELLWTLTIHRDAELRLAVRPTVARLVARHAAFGDRFLQMLLASLLRRLLPEGVDAHVVRIVREDFAARLGQVPTEVVWRLLRSKSGAAQELGGVLLPNHVDPQSIDIAQVVELASHEVLSVRQAAWGLLDRMVPRLKADLAAAVGVLDAKWEDSRRFAFQLFDTQFVKEDFDPVVLVSVCDSVRPDVQQFGRRLITRHFDEAAGEDTLLKLSEHPAAEVQLFATNFLERYASDAPDRLSALAPYFVRILCAVNRGRSARQRVQAFLRAEALKSEAAAEIVAEILGRHAATDAVEDRAAAIATLVAIRIAWPALALPLVLSPFPLREAAP